MTSTLIQLQRWQPSGRWAATPPIRAGWPPSGRSPWLTVGPGYDDEDGASIVDPLGDGPAIGFLRVPEGKLAKNRVHIEVRVPSKPPWDMTERERLIRAKAIELAVAGAVAVREESYGPQLGHIVMLDPEGNEFCVP